MASAMKYDVAIIGGGPSGSTCATILKKYAPSLKVAVLERETFPRDHIGESLLPPISPILEEMGCWDAVEAAGFPIKIGATYRWGRHPELWDFDFIPGNRFQNEPRPAKFEGQRRLTSFQVDRSVYDKVLLDGAASKGCAVHEGTKVTRVVSSGSRIESLNLESGDKVESRYYVDASGNSGILRRSLGIECRYPSTLKNIAIYDYWQNADWAVQIGVGGTRIQVLSLGYGWIWFIPIGPTRTSVGLVIPADYYKQSGRRPEELYSQALQEEPIVAGLLKNATSEGLLQTTRDWSFVADRHVGDNWFLVGECSGFADPILSAGVTMGHIGGRQAAYTILELERGVLDAAWLKDQFERRQKQRIETHIRFGDYWYTANRQLKDLKEFTSQLAQDNGLDMNPEKAWNWIASGGFINEDLNIGAGGFSLSAIRDSGEFLAKVAFESPLETHNVLTLNLQGAEKREFAVYVEGRVVKAPCYFREGRVLPITREVELLLAVLQHESKVPRVLGALSTIVRANPNSEAAMQAFGTVQSTLEAMIHDSWVKPSRNPREPLVKLGGRGSGFHWHRDKRN
jgi:flavin-dependent dehydrogenase